MTTQFEPPIGTSSSCGKFKLECGRRSWHFLTCRFGGSEDLNPPVLKDGALTSCRWDVFLLVKRLVTRLSGLLRKICIIVRLGANSNMAILKASMKMMIECIIGALGILISVQGLRS
jgi:hypothetical protein